MDATTIRHALAQDVRSNPSSTANTKVLVEIAAQLAELYERMTEIVGIFEQITNANGFRTLYTEGRQ